METQFKTLARLLKRKCGVTAREIMEMVGTVCPHKRMSDMKDRGWVITKKKVAGKNFHRYYGEPPEVN